MASRLYTIVLHEEIGDRLEELARHYEFPTTTHYATEILISALNKQELIMQAGLYRRLQSEMRDFFDLAPDQNGYRPRDDDGRSFDDNIPF